jgi:hypothetical protein
MMKLKFEVQSRPASETRIALKPLGNCGLHGVLVYDLPRRAADQMQPGAVVEASILLPDHYPVEERSRKSLHCDSWRKIDSAPLGERLLLGAFDYFGPGKHAVVIGQAQHIDNPHHAGMIRMIPCWRADLGQGEQTFTPTHWQPMPRLVEN